MKVPVLLVPAWAVGNKRCSCSFRGEAGDFGARRAARPGCVRSRAGALGSPGTFGQAFPTGVPGAELQNTTCVLAGSLGYTADRFYSVSTCPCGQAAFPKHSHPSDHKNTPSRFSSTFAFRTHGWRSSELSLRPRASRSPQVPGARRTAQERGPRALPGHRGCAEGGGSPSCKTPGGGYAALSSRSERRRQTRDPTGPSWLREPGLSAPQGAVKRFPQ